MVELFVKGGGFMWPILGIGIIGLIFVFERLFHLISGLGANEKFAVDVAERTKSDGFQSGLERCQQVNGPVSNLCYNALEVASEGAEEAEKVLDQTGGIEMASLEKNMTWISLCIATAPMIGFLGTVWGMIEAFNRIEQANDISPAIVAGGISIALLTTAFGLVVAVILQVLQNTVLYIIDNQIVTMQKATSHLMQAIKERL